LFINYGTVTRANVIRDKATNASKGFGFVHMGTMQEATVAINALNGYQVGSKRLRVSFKQQK
jgi:RNA recognition motif-containing protein